MCPKLTDRHIYRSKINKMKVANCTQVFSHQVGTLMKRISKWGELPPEATDTADLLLLLDKIFDSFNGSNKIAPSTKPLKGGVTIKSGHFEFWLNSLDIIKTFKFFCPKRGFVSVPSVSNLICTIRGFHYLVEKLLQDNFVYVLLRAFNQDCSEIFSAAYLATEVAMCHLMILIAVPLLRLCYLITFKQHTVWGQTVRRFSALVC